MYKPENLRICTFTTFFFLFSGLVKNAFSKRHVEDVKQVIRMAEFEILNLKSYFSKLRWIFSISPIWSRDIAFQVLAIPLVLRYP